jgi:hypothetical protein
MVSPSHETHLLREFMLGRNFQIERGFGMIASRKRLGRSLKPVGKEMERRTWLWSVRPRGEKEMVLRFVIHRVVLAGFEDESP